MSRKIYKIVALIVVLVTGFYIWNDAQAYHGSLIDYIDNEQTFTLARIMLSFSIGFGLGALLEADCERITMWSGVAIFIVLLFVFVFDPYYEILSRGAYLWLMYIFFGGALSDAFFSDPTVFDKKDESDDKELDDLECEPIDEYESIEELKPIKECEPIEQPTKTADGYDSLLIEIAHDIIENQRVSVSHIQRTYSVGFNRSCRILSQLEKAGIVAAQVDNSPREILLKEIAELDKIDFKEIFNPKEIE